MPRTSPDHEDKGTQGQQLRGCFGPTFGLGLLFEGPWVQGLGLGVADLESLFSVVSGNWAWGKEFLLILERTRDMGMQMFTHRSLMPAVYLHGSFSWQRVCSGDYSADTHVAQGIFPPVKYSFPGIFLPGLLVLVFGIQSTLLIFTGNTFVISNFYFLIFPFRPPNLSSS